MGIFDKPKVHEPEFTKNQAADDMRKAREEGQRWGLNNLLTAHVVNPYMLKYHNDPSATNYNIQLAHIYENGIQEGRRLRRSEMKREFEQKN